MPEQLSLFEALPQDIVSSETESTPPTNHLRILGGAVVICDGLLFIRTLYSIDTVLRVLKYSPLQFNAFSHHHSLIRSSPPSLARTRLGFLAHSHYVSLRNIPTHSQPLHPRSLSIVLQLCSNLTRPIVSHLFPLALALPGQPLPTLGRGIGCVVLQAATESGCSAFSIDLMERPAEMASEQRAQMMMRAPFSEGRALGRCRARTREHAQEATREQTHGALTHRAYEAFGEKRDFPPFRLSIAPRD